jgi:hypothetical protein
MKKNLFFLTTLFAINVFATSWVDIKVDDPILKGKTCKVNKPSSYGSYIYEMPSKYDQVFWPYSDLNNIWFCKSSGYVSFMNDFDELNEFEKHKIENYLINNKLKNPSGSELLRVLEDLYALRDIDAESRNMHMRAYARLHQSLGNIDMANKYRKNAYIQIKASLQGNLFIYKRLEYLYLATNYTRYFEGLNESHSYYEQLVYEINSLTDDESKGYGEYLKKLVLDSQYIVAGKNFDPILPKESVDS